MIGEEVSRMFIKKCFFVCILALAVHFSLSAQTHTAIPLGHPVYHVIDQAQMRGLLRPLPGARPYSRAQILEFITEILNSDADRRFGRLSSEEREILLQFRRELTPARAGLDWVRGTYSGDQYRNDRYFSWEVGFGYDIGFGIGVFPIAGGYRHNADSAPGFEGANHPRSGDVFPALDMGLTISWNGDMGRNMSYGISVSGRVLRNPRSVLGTFYSDPWNEDNPDRNPRRVTVFSEPHAYFPFSHRKRWDGFVLATSNVSNGDRLAWPQTVSIGYTMMPEFAATGLGGNIFFRFARLEREWGAMTNNSSLVLNESAQPFLGMELIMVPFHRMKFSAITGMLEYHNAGIFNGNYAEIKGASTFQSAFSMVMAELNWQRLHIGIGTTSIWPRRFELGYMFPWADNLLHSNSTGGSDNTAVFFNLQGRHPAVGKAWFSLFMEELSFSRPVFERTSMMFAFQFGASTHIPISRLPFSTITVSYTRVEPFNYTHNRRQTPWHGGSWMETNYVNFGRSLGHYLPPNSDEILVRFETLPTPNSRVRLQYQLIRHGAAFGDRAVAGSSLWSEMQPHDRSELRNHFLRDGAYQWLNILRLRGDYSFTGSNIPIRVFAEVGGVYSFFTDIRGEPNTGRYSFRRIDTPQYPQALRFIATMGIQIFPK